MASVLTRIRNRPLIAGTLAVVVGYVVLALTSTLVQEVWLGGVSFQNSPTRVLVLAALFTPLCGVVAGVVAALIGRQAAMASAITIGVLILAETTYLYSTGKVDGPLWFEAGAGLTLAAAVLLGAWIGRWKVRLTIHSTR